MDSAVELVRSAAQLTDQSEVHKYIKQYQDTFYLSFEAVENDQLLQPGTTLNPEQRELIMNGYYAARA